MEFNKLIDHITQLQGELNPFRVEFLDKDKFKLFADDLYSQVGGYSEVCITGYFSETIRGQLERILAAHKLKLVTHELRNEKRDQKNLEVMKKLVKAGAEVRISDRLHARMLLAHYPNVPGWSKLGLLVLGSFDFNVDCIGVERFDAGIKTNHPDLILEAKKLFEHIWSESKPLKLEE